MTNCVAKGLSNLLKDFTELKSPKPNRVRGCMWMAASGTAILGGLLMTAAGGALLFAATCCASTGVGVFGAIVLGSLGTMLVLSGVPAGIWISSKLAAKSWTDLSTKRVVKIHSTFSDPALS